MGAYALTYNFLLR